MRQAGQFATGHAVYYTASSYVEVGQVSGEPRKAWDLPIIARFFTHPSLVYIEGVVVQNPRDRRRRPPRRVDDANTTRQADHIQRKMATVGMPGKGRQGGTHEWARHD
jgi:hypothetical protein